MAKHRVIAFDDPTLPRVTSVLAANGFLKPVADERIRAMFRKTILGYAILGALIFGTYLACAIAFGVAATSIWKVFGFGCFIYLGGPLVNWWFHVPITVLWDGCTKADAANPLHARALQVCERARKKSGASHSVPLYCVNFSAPGAFALGPTPRRAAIMFTEALVTMMDDDELEAVFAHELAHILTWDVALNHLILALSNFYFLILMAGLYPVMSTLDFFRQLLGFDQHNRLLSNFLATVFLAPAFIVTSRLTNLIQLFVVRAREHSADALGSTFTGNPCAMLSALQKLSDWTKNNRSKPGSFGFAFFQAYRPVMIIDPMMSDNDPEPDPKPQTLFKKFCRLLRHAGDTHPPFSERIDHLKRMNGGSCP